MRRLSSPGGWRPPSASARSLVAWLAPQLDAMAAALHARCLSWATAWGLELPLQDQPTCIRARDAGEAPWLGLVQEHGIGAWIRQPPEFAAWVARSLVGIETPNTRVAIAVVGSCLEDLRRRLAGAGGWLPCPSAVQPAVLPQAFARWSEGVLAVLPAGLRLLFDAAAARAVLTECGAPLKGHARPDGGGAVVSVASAMAETRMQLRVHLEGCELELGSLRELQVGDVLRLRHGIELPASVRTAGGEALFSGFLVRSRGRKAVELAPTPGRVSRGEP
jgi:hypothetical protein